MDFETFVRAEIDGLARRAGVLVRDRQLAHDMLAAAPLGARVPVTGVWTGSELLVWGLTYPPSQANTGESSYRAAGLQFAPKHG